MDLHHLRHFIAVAEEGHFGRAAARLGIEPSPLSRSIRALEGQLQVPLLHRTHQGSTLTAHGVALLPEARDLLARAAGLKAHLRQGRTAADRHLRIAVCDAVATLRIGFCVLALRQAHRDLAVSVAPIAPADIPAALETGSIDGCLALNPPDSNSLAQVVGWTERFVAVFDTDRPGSECRELPVSTLLGAPEVLVSDAWAQPAEAWLRALAGDATIPPVRAIASHLGLLTTLAMGSGIGLLPSGMEDSVSWLGLGTRSVAGRNPRLPVAFLYHPANPHPGLAALRAVIGARPWRGPFTALFSAPAETLDHSP